MVFLQALKASRDAISCAATFERNALMEIRFAKMLVLGMLWMPLGCSDKPEPRFRASPVEEPRKEVKIDEGPRLAFNYDARMHFGLTVIKDAYGDPVTKRLTFAADGQTNSTLVQIDSRFLEFGGHEGLWAQQDHKFPNGSRSTWALRNGSVSISQVLKLVLAPTGGRGSRRPPAHPRHVPDSL